MSNYIGVMFIISNITQITWKFLPSNACQVDEFRRTFYSFTIHHLVAVVVVSIQYSVYILYFTDFTEHLQLQFSAITFSFWATGI